MNVRQPGFYIGSFVGMLLCLSTFFTVHEGSHAILLRLGNIVVDAKGSPRILKPGLHWHVPLVTRAKIFDVRLQTLEPPPSRVGTAEMKDLLVDYYVKWRINDISVFYKRTSGRVEHAKVLLEQQISDSLRAAFGKRSIREVVSDDRLNVMSDLRTAANKNASELGIEIVDVRIKRIDLPDEVSASVYSRMRTDRQRVATEHRAEGQAKAESIRAHADKDVVLVLAEAKKEAEHIRSEGDTKAGKIYAEAYDKDPEFYSFYRSILAYRKVFTSRQDVLVLRPDSQFFRYFNGPQQVASDKH